MNQNLTDLLESFEKPFYCSEWRFVASHDSTFRQCHNRLIIVTDWQVKDQLDSIVEQTKNARWTGILDSFNTAPDKYKERAYCKECHYYYAIDLNSHDLYSISKRPEFKKLLNLA